MIAAPVVEVPKGRFNEDDFNNALAYRGHGPNWRYSVKKKNPDDPRSPLVRCDVKAASEYGHPVWTQENEPYPAFCGVKAKNADIAIYRNLTLEGEYPSDPSVAHRLAKALCVALVKKGLIPPGGALDNSGAGFHLPIPIVPIVTADYGGGDVINAAVRNIVDRHILPIWEEICRDAGVAIDLEGSDISRIMSYPGTRRPGGSKPNEAEYLRNGFLRGWLPPHDVEVPIRVESPILTTLITTEALIILQAKQEAARRPVQATHAPQPGDGEYWLNKALQKTHIGSRNRMGFWLACQLRDAGMSIMDAASVMDAYARGVPGKDYTVREAQRSLDSAYSQPAREAAKSQKPRGKITPIRRGGRRIDPETGEITDILPADGGAGDGGSDDEDAGGEEDAEQHADQAEGGKKKRQKDLLDAAMLWKAQYGEDWGHDPHTHIWHHWEGTHYEPRPRPDGDLDEMAMSVLRQTKMAVSSSSRVDGCTRFAGALCRRQFSPPEGYVNFNNGTLTTITGDFLPHDRDHGFTYCLPFEYRHAPYPKIDDFLKRTIPDPIGIKALMIHIGLALLRDQDHHKALLLIGPPRSGKSTILQLANATCGQDPYGNAGPELFSTETEGLRSRASWGGRRIVTLEELPVEALRNEEVFKAMAAHGGVAMRQLWQPHTLENRWGPKLVMATNERPRYSDRTGALSRRLSAISCPNGLADSGLDSFLLKKMLPELPGFAAQCLVLASTLLLDSGQYPMSDDMRNLLAEIEEQGDALKAWLRDRCTVVDPAQHKDPEHPPHTTIDALYRDYCRYCVVNGNKALGRERFGQAVIDRHPGKVQRSRHRPAEGKSPQRPEGGGNPQRCLDYILLQPVENGDDAEF
jgi:hypothetical protein